MEGKKKFGLFIATAKDGFPNARPVDIFPSFFLLMHNNLS